MTGLGGRLPLLDADTLDAEQRELFDHLQTRVVPRADAAGFRSTTADGIPGAAVRRLATGTLPDTLRDDEKVAYRFTQQLSTSHRVDHATFIEARKAFGDRGIGDIVILAGTYYTVCGLLNAFDVPAPTDNPN